MIDELKWKYGKDDDRLKKTTNPCRGIKIYSLLYTTEMKNTFQNVSKLIRSNHKNCNSHTTNNSLLNFNLYKMLYHY